MSWRALGVLMLGGCASASSVPEPAFGPHPAPVEQWIEVETAPPVKETDELGPRPSPQHVWIDGQWSYQPVARRWLWEQGRWCRAPADTLYYARPSVARQRQVVLDNGEPRRVTRWNNVQQRYERVDVQQDTWRWLKGTFYVRGTDGKPVAYQGPSDCEERKKESGP